MLTVLMRAAGIAATRRAQTAVTAAAAALELAMEAEVGVAVLLVC
jgi:hypothetical protein